MKPRRPWPRAQRGAQPTVLFKLKDWEMRIDCEVDEDPWAAHVSCKERDGGAYNMRYSWFTTDKDFNDTEIPARCCFCYEAVPDELQALIRLHKGEM